MWFQEPKDRRADAQRKQQFENLGKTALVKQVQGSYSEHRHTHKHTHAMRNI